MASLQEGVGRLSPLMTAGTEVLLLVVREGSGKMANGVSRAQAGARGLRRNIVLVANYHSLLLHGTHPEDCAGRLHVCFT